MSHSAYIWELMERKGGWSLVGRDLPVEARRSSEVVPPPEIGGLKYKESVSAFLDQIVKDRQAKSIANVGRDISRD